MSTILIIQYVVESLLLVIVLAGLAVILYQYFRESEK